jgi:hypothetical protein
LEEWLARVVAGRQKELEGHDVLDMPYSPFGGAGELEKKLTTEP